MTPTARTESKTVGNWETLGLQSRVTVVASAADTPDFEERLKAREFIQVARERFAVSRDASSKQREEMLVDLRFRCGIQWDEAIQRKRDSQGRPCLTINRIPGFLKHVLNNLRQARPEIKIDPVGDGDSDIAEIKQGLIRHILIASRADLAFDTAFEAMATMGLGYFRIVDGWSDPKSFDKDLFIEWVPNAFAVYFDPGARKPDWSDAKYCFIIEDLSVAEFKQRFGADKYQTSLDDFQSIGDHQATWRPGGKIRIAEYFHIEEEEDTLCEMADGSVEYFTDLPEETPDNPQPAIVRTRPARRRRVIWSLIDGVQVLKERVWKGQYIPVIPTLGNQIELDGERILVGMVRFAREAQRMYNYMYSSFVEAIALAPKSPFIAEFDQIQDFRNIWDAANKEAVAVLPYRAKSAEGNLVPPPQRQQAEPPIGAFVEGLKLADQNLKATFSIYEAALGQKGPQESGLAINARKVESDVATYDWIDNFNRAICYLGIVLDDLLPHYYNTPGRIVQIVREDDTRKSVLLNKDHDVEGETKKFDLAQGKSVTTISSQPSFATRRQEAAHGMIELAKFYPPLMQVAGPQVVRAMDWPDHDVIAAQLEKAMPPELREPDENAPPVNPEMEQKLAQAVQMVQQLTEALHEASSKTEMERMKEEFSTLRSEIAAMASITVADRKAGSDEASILVNQIFDEWKQTRAAIQALSGGAAPSDSSQPAPGGPGPQGATGSPAAGAMPPVENTPPGVGTGQ